MATLPYIGSKISLISNAEIRYEGTLYTINTEESTIALQNVKSFGTEGRKQLVVPGSNERYQFIIFRGKDIKSLTVIEAPKNKNLFQDPAIVSTNAPPRRGKGGDNHGWQGWSGPAVKGGGQQWGGKGQQWSGGKNYQGQWGGGKNYQSGGKGGRGGKSGGKPSGKRAGGQRRDVGERGHPVGELIPGEKSETVGNDFDFEASNARGEAELRKDVPVIACGYDKSAGFFDSISAEKGSRATTAESREQLREQQRGLDKSTFGEAAKRPLGRRVGRNRRS